MLSRVDIRAVGPQGGPVPRINEGETIRLTIQVLDADLAKATPTAARMAIIDLEQGTAILDWTAILPAPSYVTWINDSSANIIISATQNALRNGGCIERRQVVFEMSDADGRIRRSYDYEVADLQVLT